MIGAYVAGDSLLHRTPAGVKLGLLAASVVVIALLPAWWMLAIALSVVLSGFAVARIPPRVAARQLVPVLWILAIAAPLNALFSGWESALVMSMRLAGCVALAALVTLTTQVSAILDAAQRGLRPLAPRIDADRVGIVLAMTIRAVPLLAEIVRAVLEARKARGAEASLRAVAVPVVVRALQTADAMGEALVARGFDD
ncbi:energy-coupling factor transporter transmembrane component T family protein [Agromyces laixinhei]|uniref:energy-coupling factor transporter transmembrane component T family protein n=1 Tax=Agromyces laixinhei TaxID=2585717 RepID=UPI0011164900|nr:energy-coupling factor transporter transmembrane protein EcfT [Agromyces laixinhei]